MLQYILVLTFLCVARIFYKIYFYQMHEKLKNFTKYPYVDLPLIGHAYRLVGRSVEGKMMKMIRDFSDLNESYVLWVLGKPVVILSDPKDVQLFLKSPVSLEKGSPFEGLYGNRMSVLTAHVPIWKPLRRSLNSAFSLASMKYYMKSFNSSTIKMIDDLDKNCNNKEFDVAKIVGRCGTKAAFSSHIRKELTDDEVNTSYKIMESGLVLMGYRMIHFYYEFILKRIRYYLDIDYKIRKFEKYFLDRMEPHAVKLLENLDAYNTGENDVDYFLKRMVRCLKMGEIHEKDILEHLGIFLVSAANTGSVAASFALLLLAMNPDIQEKLYEELKTELYHKDEQIDYITIMTKLPYLDRVFKETLRLLPAIPMLSRKTNGKDFELPGGRIIPADTDVLVPIICIQRNHDIWGKDALKFNPDNFLSENISQKPVCAYLPFVYGERSCIGYKYATSLSKLIVARAIRNFKFTTKLTFAELRYGFAITLKVNNGCMVRMERRE